MIVKRGIILQLIFVLILCAIGYYFAANAAQNLAQRDIATGFGFLEAPAGFDIILHLIEYTPQSTYLRAFVVGILNTLLLSGIAIFTASCLGTIVGVGHVSRNWLVAKLATSFVEVFRNVPLLLQIFFWYYIILKYLPMPNDSYILFNTITINIRGISFHSYTIIPELLTMIIALSLYSASYIAETVRAGILSVRKQEIEAALALGFKSWQTTYLVIFPQSLRVIIPPLTSQYLNIIKNTSLSAAIGFPDLVAVFAGTALNQTGQAIETIFMTMSVYLIISLCVSLLMNWYNRKILMVER